MSEKNWFAYSPDGGMEYFATESEARASAEAALEYYTDGFIDEDVANICWGRVHGESVCVEHTETPGGEFDYVERWEMQEVEVVNKSTTPS